MNKISLKAYAKLNLSLDITGRREDGYHLIKTVMQSIDLCDIVTVEKTSAKGISVVCENAEIPNGSGNIAYKAAEAFFEYTGKSEGIAVSIKKNIPWQAGMGGGSADAAAVIYGLNTMLSQGLSYKSLCDIAVGVGADVPFCIAGGTALAEGIGESLTPLNPPKDCLFVWVKPPIGISTAAAYSKADSIGISRRPDIGSLQRELEKGGYAWHRYLINVFEELCDIDEINTVKAIMLSGGALAAQMTGSGSAVFAVLNSIEAADNVCKALLEKGYVGHIARPIACGVEQY